ncbi:hypothetical protein FQN60_011543, partial [Etheostoma spectabile]
MWSCIKDFLTYETTKSVVVKSWTIGIINRVVQLLIITYFIGWVFVNEKAYQVRDTAIESSVMTKVKGFGIYNDKVMDVADYVTPTQGASVFCIITKMITTENQVQGYCPESEKKYICTHDNNCTRHLNKPGSYGILTGKCVPFNSTVKLCEIRGWCPAEIDTIKTRNLTRLMGLLLSTDIMLPNRRKRHLWQAGLLPLLSSLWPLTNGIDPSEQLACGPLPLMHAVRLSFSLSSVRPIVKRGIPMREVENFTIFIKNSIRFPTFNYTKGNFPTTISEDYIKKCNFDMVNNTYCPIFRVGDVVRYAQQNFTKLADKAGKFNMIPTLINMVAAFTSVGVGTVLCDIILLNFLKGAEQYKAKKFEE